MFGTWFFNNPEGDDEQMAIFPDRRVVVLYSNGNKDETIYYDGYIELAEYGGAKFKITILEDSTLFQYKEAQGIAKIWTRIDPLPQKTLLRPLKSSSGQTEITFEAYFPDDIEAGKKLDEWWKNKESMDMMTTLSLTFSEGIRRCSVQYKNNFLMQYIGGNYVCISNLMTRELWI